jgi:formylglycine-generating enzyme required for sulfatase activity
MRAKYIYLFLFLAANPAASAKGLVSLPAGSLEVFWLAEKNTKEATAQPALKIRVEAFSAQPTAVTNSDYIRFLEGHPRWRKSQVSPLFADQSYLKQFQEDLRLKQGVNAHAPVTNVSWFAAMAYCQAKGLRLPNTDEWEYMAAASESKVDASRDPAFLARILDWYARPSRMNLPGVKSTYRNLYGLYDLHGLIWEWTEDFNSNFVTGESREDGALDRNLFCGAGNFAGANKENYAAFMRFAFRSSMIGKGSVWNLGFRCVK